MRPTIVSVLITSLLGALAVSALAGTKAGVTMPDTVEVAGKQLTLNGMGLREATRFKVDVYVAGLYLENPSSDPAEIIRSDQVKRLVLQFKRGVDRGDIVEAWRTGFQGNATVPLAQIQPQIDQLEAMMPDFREGNTLTFTYIPGDGVHVHVGTTEKGVLRGKSFADSLFAIWLGPKPPGAALKQGLVGGR